MKFLNEGRYPGEHLASEAKGMRSRDVMKCSAAVAMQDGTEVAKVTATKLVVPKDPTKNDGSQTTIGTLYGNYEPELGYDGATRLVKSVVVIARDAEVVEECLITPVGADDAGTATNRANSIAALRALGIIPR